MSCTGKNIFRPITQFFKKKVPDIVHSEYYKQLENVIKTKARDMDQLAKLDATSLGDLEFFHLMETGQGELFKLLVKNYERNVDNNIVKEKKKRDKKWFHFLWSRKKELESTATEAEHGKGHENYEQQRKGKDINDAGHGICPAAGMAGPDPVQILEDAENKVEVVNNKNLHGNAPTAPVSEIEEEWGPEFKQVQEVINKVEEEVSDTLALLEEAADEELIDKNKRKGKFPVEMGNSHQPAVYKPAFNSEALDIGRMKKNNHWWTRDDTKQIIRGIRHDIRQRGRTSGFQEFRANWRENKWLAVPRLFLYYINPMHCIGLNRLYRKFQEKFLLRDDKLEKRMQDNIEAEFSKDGKALFDILCHLHMIQLDNEPVEINIHDKNELDQLINVLKQFALSALLIPLRLQHGYYDVPEAFWRQSGEHDLLEVLKKLRAVLTDKSVFDAVKQRMERRLRKEVENQGSSSGSTSGHSRQKRAGAIIMPSMAFAGISFGAGPIGILVGAGIAILGGIPAYMWCNDA